MKAIRRFFRKIFRFIRKWCKRLLVKTRLIWLYHQIKKHIGGSRYNKRMDEMLKTIADFPRDPNKKLVLITGHIGLQKKMNFQKLIQKLQEQMPNVQFVVLDEARLETEGNAYECEVPRIEIDNLYRDVGYLFRDEEEIEGLFSEKRYMSNSFRNLMGRRKGKATKLYIQNILLAYRMIYKQAAECLKPDLVLIWSKFSAIHSMCDEFFKEQGIEVNYIEYGSLPGTYGLEGFGQMGESYPSREWEEFLQLPVDEKELEHADKVWNYLQNSGLNRNVQQADDVVEQVKAVMKPGRPVVLFAGNLDFDAGIVPYTYQSMKYHSPMFQTSDQALSYLSAIAIENDWNLVFKPHPSIASFYEKRVPQNVIYIPSGNLNDLIDFADATVTIMSQTAYISCIRRRPMVMLGYNQIRNKGCVYDAYVHHEIESTIKEAIEKGFTKEKEQAFRKHIAQMCKYYLYDDGADRDLRYGQSVEKMAEYIKKVLEEKKNGN